MAQDWCRLCWQVNLLSQGICNSVMKLGSQELLLWDRQHKPARHTAEVWPHSYPSASPVLGPTPNTVTVTAHPGLADLERRVF